LNFLNPLAFSFLALAGLIVLLYLLKLKRRPHVVSSTLFWFRAVQDLEANAPFQKLRRNLLLFLQLLLLLLLVFALTRPFMRSASRVEQSIVAILDCSASMQAVDVSPNRFEVARRGVREVIEDLSEGDRLMLIAASNQARVVHPFSDNRSELLAALDRLMPVDTQTQLSEAFLLAQSLLQNQDNGEILIFSDGCFDPLPPLANRGTGVNYVTVGNRSENLALTALDVRPDPKAPEAYQLFTSVSNFAPETRTVDLELYVDDRIVDNQEVTILAGRSTAQVFRVSGVQESVLKVRLDVKDDLQVDNEAYALFAPADRTDVLLVGKRNYFLEHALSLDPLVSLTVDSASNEADPSVYDLVVYSGECPQALSPQGNYLFIDCAPQSWDIVEGDAKVEFPTVVDWNRTHPLMRFVDLENLIISSSLKLKLPASAEVLVESLESPLMALSIEQGRHLSLYIPFDLFNSNWMLRTSFPIFVANLIDFCRDSPGEAGVVQAQTGRPVPVFIGSRSSPESLEIRAPDGQLFDVPVSGDPTFFASTQQAGLYEITTPGWEGERIAVNLLSRKESDLLPRSEIQLGTQALAASTGSLETNKELWKTFAILALLVFLVEWWVYHRRLGV
jgi:Ca-activated chloride channel family protein